METGGSSGNSSDENAVDRFYSLLRKAKEEKEQMDVGEAALTLGHMKNSNKEASAWGAKRRRSMICYKQTEVRYAVDSEETETDEELETHPECQPDPYKRNRSGDQAESSSRQEISPEVTQLITDYRPPVIPDVPPGVREIIGEHIGPFEKQLSHSDIDHAQSRLAINKKHMRRCIEPLIRDGENLAAGMNVTVYDMKGKEHPMVFKTWGREKVTVFNKGWKKFMIEKGLREYEDFVTLWAFRHAVSDALSFVMSSRRLPVYVALNKKYEK